MGSIISAVEAVEQLRFVQVKKGDTPEVTRALHLGDNCYLLQLKGGSFTVAGRSSEGSLVNGNCAVLGFGTEGSTSKPVMDGLVRLGVITKEQAAEHVRVATEGRARRQRKHDLQALKRVCEDLGIPVPEVPEAS